MSTCYKVENLFPSSQTGCLKHLNTKNVHLRGEIPLFIWLVFKFLKTLHIQGTLNIQPFKQRLILLEEMQKSLFTSFPKVLVIKILSGPEEYNSKWPVSGISPWIGWILNFPKPLRTKPPFCLFYTWYVVNFLV